MQPLADIFQQTKEVLCKYDYYIYASGEVLHLTNSELKIPHLMGMQYVGRPNQFTGDFGVYSIKKKRITHESIRKLVRKYYRSEKKQQIIIEMIYRKLNNLHLIKEIFHSYSELYLYEKSKETDTKFDCDYLLIHESGKVNLYLGLVKSQKNKNLYHCNSFMATYQSDRKKNLFSGNLSKQYEINKIVRENKQKSFICLKTQLPPISTQPRPTQTAKVIHAAEPPQTGQPTESIPAVVRLSGTGTKKMPVNTMPKQKICRIESLFKTA